MLKARLNQADCLTNGWVLDGFPANINQAREFEKAGINPNKYRRGEKRNKTKRKINNKNKIKN
jgi:adenylate kinase family enzyme